MGFKDRFGKLVGIEEEPAITDDEVNAEIAKMKENEQVQAPRTPLIPAGEAPRKAPGARISVGSTSAFKLVVIEPKGFEECPKLVDNLKGRRPVIINLENIETETARKIFDFLSGATYALNGNVKKVASNIFIFAPESVDIAASQEERSFDFSQNKNAWR